jgi:hypothetical protein
LSAMAVTWSRTDSDRQSVMNQASSLSPDNLRSYSRRLWIRAKNLQVRTNFGNL